MELDEQQKLTFKELAATGCDLDLIADALAVDRYELNKAVARSKELQIVYRHNRAKLLYRFMDTLINSGTKDKDVSAAMFFLKSQAGWSEGDRSKLVVRKLLEFIEAHPDSLINRDQLVEEIKAIGELDS